MKSIVIQKLTRKEEQLVREILETWNRKKANAPRKRLISTKTLFSLLKKDEQALVEKILTINPTPLGWKGEWHGILGAPHNLVRVETHVDVGGGCHYLPKKAHHAFLAMNKAFHDELRTWLYLESGYRSSAYQIMLFLEQLEKNAFNMKKTARRVALPGWSEHGAPHIQALDFTTKRALEGKKEDFAKTPHYAWLLENARDFGLHLSYPKNNKLGVMFEPWHWRYASE